MSTQDRASGPVRYFFNPTTGQVEEGRQSSWRGRMGPYATREEAERALERAAQRNEAWDEEEERRRAEEDDDD